MYCCRPILFPPVIDTIPDSFTSCYPEGLFSLHRLLAYFQCLTLHRYFLYFLFLLCSGKKASFLCSALYPLSCFSLPNIWLQICFFSVLGTRSVFSAMCQVPDLPFFCFALDFCRLWSSALWVKLSRFHSLVSRPIFSDYWRKGWPTSNTLLRWKWNI